MEITDIRVRHIGKDGRLRASASVVLDGEFAVHDIKIIESQDRVFLAMPARQLADGRFRDIVHPISREMRERLESSILAVYHNTKGESTTFSE